MALYMAPSHDFVSLLPHVVPCRAMPACGAAVTMFFGEAGELVRPVIFADAIDAAKARILKAANALHVALDKEQRDVAPWSNSRISHPEVVSGAVLARSAPSIWREGAVFSVHGCGLYCHQLPPPPRGGSKSLLCGDFCESARNRVPLRIRCWQRALHTAAVSATAIITAAARIIISLKHISTSVAAHLHALPLLPPP